MVKVDHNCIISIKSDNTENLYNKLAHQLTEPAALNSVAATCCGDVTVQATENRTPLCGCGEIENIIHIDSGCGCSGGMEKVNKVNPDCGCSTENDEQQPAIFWKKLFKEAVGASTMVIKFMVVAYFLEAIIVLYIPSQFITMLLGKNVFISILLAALIGVPVYTSSMPALALVGGLMN